MSDLGRLNNLMRVDRTVQLASPLELAARSATIGRNCACACGGPSPLLAFVLSQPLNVPPLLGLWAILTAVVVTQMSIGGSLQATTEYVVGTLGGAPANGLAVLARDT
jgi:hypothetical protein